MTDRKDQGNLVPERTSVVEVARGTKWLLSTNRTWLEVARICDWIKEDCCPTCLACKSHRWDSAINVKIRLLGKVGSKCYPVAPARLDDRALNQTQWWTGGCLGCHEPPVHNPGQRNRAGTTATLGGSSFRSPARVGLAGTEAPARSSAVRMAAAVAFLMA